MKRAVSNTGLDEYIAQAKSWIGDQPTFGGVAYLSAPAGSQTYSAVNLVGR